MNDLQLMLDREKGIMDYNAWYHITNLNNLELFCDTADEVIAAFEALKAHNMVRGILRCIPKFDTEENCVIINFDYFHSMICECKIRLGVPPPLQKAEEFLS